MKTEHSADSSPDKCDSLTDTGARAVTTLRHWLSLVTEPHILYPAIAILALCAIWGTTLNLIEREYTAAENAAAVSGYELAETYESQVLRSLREIDQTLQFVKYAVGRNGEQTALQGLKARKLLPADLLFTVSIANTHGDIVASTRPPEKPNVADRDFFQSQLQADDLAISRPYKSTKTGEWKLEFSRRLGAADGEFSGIVMVSVDATYFVSSYESSKLGEHGVLGLLGSDDIFRVRRSGETVSVGDSTNYAAVVSFIDAIQGKARLITNDWDGVRRYTSARQLYNFPLVAIVGLSSDEQMKNARQNKQTYLWRATASSLLLILIMATLWRLGWQLAQSHRREVEEQIAYAALAEYTALHDSLTTLPNRSMFSKLLGHSISQASRYNRQLAVLFLDLDHFKNVNDTLGHEAGDQLLQEVAARLKSCLRDSDTVARLGGDEFILLLPELDVEKYVTTVAQKILSAIARPFILLDQEFRVTASIGISTYPHDGLDEQTLTKNADIAMYHAKEEGKNNFQFYSEELNAKSLERLNLESRLRHALEHNEFELHYQVKQDISSSKLTGMEALLRWQHPDLGKVAPMQFLPLAEETGLIIPIGKWVLRTACMQNVAWQKQGMPHLVMAVNLSASQFADEHLLTDLQVILSETGMDAGLLELEITESMLTRDAEKALQIMHGLKKIGVRISIDDFGIGYSSFAALKQFPLDSLKIDRSFIRTIGSVVEDKSLTDAIITLGKALSLTVVAQGVETKEQADYLRHNTCDELQGFYLNKPVPADQMAELLRTLPDIKNNGINPDA